MTNNGDDNKHLKIQIVIRKCRYVKDTNIAPKNVSRKRTHFEIHIYIYTHTHTHTRTDTHTRIHTGPNTSPLLDQYTAPENFTLLGTKPGPETSANGDTQN